MKQLYHKDIYDVDKPIKSYWEKVSNIDQNKYQKLTNNETCDVCVIGGGFTGISTAYHIAKNYGGDVRLLEAGHFGFASSGRNAGFCCLPATKLSISQLIKKYGMDETKKFASSLSKKFKKGQVIALIGDLGSGKTTFLKCLAGLEKINFGKITLNKIVLDNKTTFIKPNHRKIGFIFQDYPLFPHLSLIDNITFNLDKSFFSF